MVELFEAGLDDLFYFGRYRYDLSRQSGAALFFAEFAFGKAVPRLARRALPRPFRECVAAFGAKVGYFFSFRFRHGGNEFSVRSAHRKLSNTCTTRSAGESYLGYACSPVFSATSQTIVVIIKIMNGIDTTEKPIINFSSHFKCMK